MEIAFLLKQIRSYILKIMKLQPVAFSTALVVNAEETDAEAIRNYLTYNGNSELVDQTVSFPYSSDISAAFTTFSKISGDDMTFEMSHSIPATPK